MLTFLRRATFEKLDPIPMPDVRNAYVKAVQRAGKSIDSKVAEKAAIATGGDPFLVQLIGYCMWEAAETRGSKKIESADVTQGIEDSITRYHDAVCKPVFANLTSAQQAFLEAMAPDYPEPTKLADIAQRTGKTASWANKYRASLIDAQVIEPVGRGLIAFAIPHFGEWIASGM